MGLFSQSRGELSVIFDIGSQNVGAALVFGKAGDMTQIIWTHREPFADETESSPRELLEGMLLALKKTNELLQKDAVSELHAKGFSVPSSIRYVLSSPWIEVQQKTVTLAFERPTTITKKTVNDAVDKQKSSLESSGFTLVDKTITGLKINGYGVKDPYDKKATVLEVSFTVAITPKEILDRIEESVSAKKADISAFSSAAYHAINGLFKNDDFLFMTIEDNSTEITVVRDGTLLLHTSIFSGSNALVQAVANECGVSFAEARSLMNFSFKRQADEAIAAKIILAVQKERDAWQKEIEASIESAGGLIVLPRTSFFIASDIGFVADIVKNQSIPEFGINQAPFNVVILDSAALKSKIVFSDAAYDDARLGLLALSTIDARANR